MTHTKSSDLEKQQSKKGRSTEEKKQDIKNAKFIAGVDRPNHPNT